jgi:hypothetical protein
MSRSRERNFAGRLAQRLGKATDLLDATNREILSGGVLTGLIVGFAAGFLIAGLGPGNGLSLDCDPGSSGTLACIGAMVGRSGSCTVRGTFACRTFVSQHPFSIECIPAAYASSAQSLLLPTPALKPYADSACGLRCRQVRSHCRFGRAL